MKKYLRFIFFVCLFLALAAPVFAQNAEFRVHAQRMMGYGNGSDVRGNFKLSIIGSLDAVQSVTYQIDGKEMATVSAAPFEFNFRTSDYPDGPHQLTAVVSTKDNRKVTTPAVGLNFLSNQQQSESFQKLFVPLITGILLLVAIGAGTQYLMMRRGGHEHLAPGAPRNYGLKGGTICPRCGRAYAIHFLSINLIGGYFDRCDYCGKWAFVHGRSRADLDAAVRAEVAAARANESAIPGLQNGETEEDRLKKMMDESKYVE